MSEKRLLEQIERLRKGVMLAIINMDSERNGLTPDGNVRERLVKLLDETELAYPAPPEGGAGGAR